MKAANLCAAIALASLAACGRGLPSGGGPPQPTGANVAPIIVDGGPPSIAIGTINLPFISVTVCLPGTTTCQAVDHVLLDTKATGLRIIASVLPATFNLPQATTAVGGTPLWECYFFAKSYIWGSVRIADVKIADGIAGNQAIQLIGDPAIATAPADCVTNGGRAENTLNTFGANGTVGLDVFQYDCGAFCSNIANLSLTSQWPYYSCPSGGACIASAASLSDQVQNPIYNFPTNNNGIAVVMPSVGTIGRVKAAGSLVLGLNTQSNNQLGNAAVVTLDPIAGSFTTTYQGQALTSSFLDSGSNAIYFNDSALTPCTQILDFYCPAQVLALSASNQQGTSATSNVLFKVDNVETLSAANPSFNALPNVAANNRLVLSFDWGLPFFYDRTVFVGFENRAAGPNTGPFVAY